MQKSMRRIKLIPVSRRAALENQKKRLKSEEALPRFSSLSSYCRAMAQPG